MSAKGQEQGASVEDRINLHQLMELKAAFDRADTDGGGSLDMEEFLEAFGEVLGKNLTHEQLTHLFMKIDANSDGSVDWDEFTNFMLLENQANADMSDRSYTERLQEQAPSSLDPNPKHVHHRDMMDGILQLPSNDRLFTHARDGTVPAVEPGESVLVSCCASTASMSAALSTGDLTRSCLARSSAGARERSYRWPSDMSSPITTPSRSGSIGGLVTCANSCLK